MYPVISNFIRKFSATSAIKSRAAGVGVGVVSNKMYLNSGSVALFNDAAVRSYTALNVGAKNGATVSVVEYGDILGWLHRTDFTFTALPITMADATQGGGVKVYDFPEGVVFINGAYASLAITTHSAIAGTLNSGVTCNWGIGTTVQASATLATTEQDILPVTAFTSSTVIDVAPATVTGARILIGASFDGTATAKDAYLNLAVAGATDIDADASMLVTGTATIFWSYLGDK